MTKINPFYIYKAKVLRVVDGDTADLDIDLGLFIHRLERVRLFGINAPETRGPERPDGLVSKHFVKCAIGGKEVLIRTELDRTGKYGRLLAIIFYRKGGKLINLNERLVNQKLAKEAHY